MECMSPPDAEAFLAAHGFTNVIWQIEGGDPASKTGDGHVATTSHQQRTAPATAVNGDTQAEIGQILSVAEGTVASWISRGRAALRRELSADR